MKQTEEEKESVLRTETLMPQAPQQPEEKEKKSLGDKPELLGLTSAEPNIEPMCEICGHEWRRHDPEDGKCDAGPPCFCGRNLTTMQQRIAQLSRAELSR